MRGKIIKFDKTRGFGFIDPDGREDDVFFHISDIIGDGKGLAPGAVVSFDLASNEKGPCAKKVNLARAAPAHAFPFFIGAAVFVFIACVVILEASFTIPLIYELIAAMNVTAFVLCGYDKGVAASKSARVPEAVLFGAAALGGGPGLLLGMKVFKHKTRKGAFLLLAVLIMIVQLWALRWAYSQGWLPKM